MKLSFHILLSFAILLCTPFLAKAGNINGIKIDIKLKHKFPAPPGRCPIPINFPIDLYLNSDNTITVEAPEHLEGCVYLYNFDNVLEDYSEVLNTTLTPTSSGYHIIFIEGNNWTGESTILIP